MVTDRQRAKATALRALQTDGVLVLPNAWDAASAALIAAGGARAIATTSAGVSWSLGRPDGQNLTRAEMVDAVARIAAAVDLPVSADVEGGYGPAAEDVAQTVAAVIDAGAVGINLEDSRAPGGPLFEGEGQAVRIRAAGGGFCGGPA
jgi:2-methylisocitrate lyase-like PEP mutase family enzyme